MKMNLAALKGVAVSCLLALLLTSCGGDGTDVGTPPSRLFALFDPTPNAGGLFGSQVVILANGNIVVTDPGDSSVASGNGAVHLYSSATRTLVASLYGNNTSDSFGSSVIALANGHFVIASPLDDVGGVLNAGSVMLVNGATGAPIGRTIAGDSANDNLASNGVIALANGHFVIASPFDDVGDIANAGSVMLFDGTTGTQIGSTIAGDSANDNLGSDGVIALTNSNFVIASRLDDGGGVLDAGSVMLVNGATGAPIGSTIAGDNVFDSLGSNGVTALSNGNFAIASPFDDVGGVLNGGSVRLVNGTTGAPIGSTIAGGSANDNLGSNGVVALTNSNFVITSPLDDVNGVLDAGSVMLVNGATGAPIGGTIAGNNVVDSLGSNGVTALSNGHFVIASPFDDVGGVLNGGSVILVDGTTGAPIGSTLAGNNDFDQLGSGDVTALSNGHFVIASPFDDAGGLLDAGSVMLVNGTTGAPIGRTITGNNDFDRLGSGSVTALSHGHFVIASPLDDVSSVLDAGSAMLVNGTTGATIGGTITGSNPFDRLASGGVSALSNGHFVIASPLDDVSGVFDAGSVILVNGATGTPIGSAIAGGTSGDVAQATVAGSATGDFLVLGLPRWDRNSLIDSGLAWLIEL